MFVHPIQHVHCKMSFVFRKLEQLHHVHNCYTCLYSLAVCRKIEESGIQSRIYMCQQKQMNKPD